MIINLEVGADKRRVAAVYNLISSGHDKPALRYAPLIADRLVELSGLQTGQKILDVATGTGAVIIPAAHVVGMTGQVIGVDIAQDMLIQARRNIATVGLANADLCGADTEQLPFKDRSVDIVICASAIYFLPDILAALRESRRVTKPGGRMTLSLFGETAFQPLANMYKARLCQYGVSPAILKQAFAWQRLTDPELCRTFLQDAGFAQIEVWTEQLGYYLRDVNEWWDIIWNSGFRGAVLQLSSVQLEQFKSEHLAEIGALATDRGIWLDVMSIFAWGRNVPGS